MTFVFGKSHSIRLIVGAPGSRSLFPLLYLPNLKPHSYFLNLKTLHVSHSKLIADDVRT
ncbi:hypothetical protein DM02DRAFT_610964 [Periconia macrospinosa]|uniref:Uncharacterized protein n=1 Tax=Periconia macrospinosa TaxID=97972 RepID=A0A2V1E447_9PLEO|nr:hypothetical protein DM02DRAFT_610964 [Periconia macrospinosa]